MWDVYFDINCTYVFTNYHGGWHFEFKLVITKYHLSCLNELAFKGNVFFTYLVNNAMDYEWIMKKQIAVNP